MAEKENVTKRVMMNPRTGTMLQLPIKKLNESEKNKFARQNSGGVIIQNQNISSLEEDYLYHLGLSSVMDLPYMFGDTKFICMGGSAVRALTFARRVAETLQVNIPPGMDLAPIGKTERYSLYKVGPVISVNHGMGMPSLSILMHELAKLMYHAGATDVIWIRIGTSGGVGISGGTVVVATESVNAKFEPYFENLVLGELKRYSSVLNKDLAELVIDCAKADNTAVPPLPAIPVVVGKTMGTDDFYEGQGRLDGAFCDYTEEDKFAFLNRAHAAGVSNIEMESTLFAAFCNRLAVPAILCNVVLLNRLNGDQITATAEELASFSNHSQELIVRFIQKRLSLMEELKEV